MSDNGIRTHLVTNFACTDCGRNLKLSYQPKEGRGPSAFREVDGITGAAKVAQHIYIEPCETCVGEARRPLQALRDAIASVSA